MEQAINSDRVTQQLAAHLARFRYDELPADAIHAGRRGMLDWLGCALAAESRNHVITASIAGWSTTPQA